VKPKYSNNPKSPRMRKGRFSTQIVTDELIRNFLKDFPKYKDFSLKDLKSVWNDITETIREETIINPLGVKFGAFTGELKYQYLPYKFKGSNHKISEELGKETNHLNIMTKGKTGKVIWERRWAVKFNKILQFYGFEEDKKIRDLSKKYTDINPEKIRVARNTLGGHSIWRQI